MEGSSGSKSTSVSPAVGGGAHGVEAGLSGELPDGAVLEDEDGRPDEVGDEASPEDDDEHGQVLPEIGFARGDELRFGDVADRLAGGQAEGEEGAHEAGEDGDGDALAEGEVALAGFGLLFGGDFVLLGVACGAVDGDADEADEDAEEDDLAGGLVDQRGDLAVVDGRNEGAEEGAKAQGDGVSKGDAEIADGESEGDAADSPENAQEDGVAEVRGVAGIGLMHDAREVGNEDDGENRRGDDPGGETLDDPVDLPRPALDAAEGDEVGGGAEAAYPVEDNAEKRIRSQDASLGEGESVKANTILPDSFRMWLPPGCWWRVPPLGGGIGKLPVCCDLLK